MIWFTSDTHFGHNNIIYYDKRPFKTIAEHDRELITRWNSVVSLDDEVYHLGDFCLHRSREIVDSILSQLNGIKMLVKGNHDSKAVTKSPHWLFVTHYHEMVVDNQHICLQHYRKMKWNKDNEGSWMLHGHSHGASSAAYNILDIGTMLWNYTPISFEMVRSGMKENNLNVCGIT